MHVGVLSRGLGSARKCGAMRLLAVPFYEATYSVASPAILRVSDIVLRLRETSGAEGVSVNTTSAPM